MNNRNVLILDDEPYSMSWLEEFVKNLGFNPLMCTNFSDALKLIEKHHFFAVSIIDMNIPIDVASNALIESKGQAYKQFHGLYIAHELRDYGNDKNSVIIFTVHDNPEISKIADTLSVQYIIKGQVRKIKEAVKKQLEYVSKLSSK
ncbi:hypothetical protein ACUZ9P_05295 [Desulfovibrio sp. QI0430]